MLDLLNEQYDGIDGVKEIDTGIEGPTVGISACTHGGEHAGLNTLKYLSDKLDIGSILIKGKIYFILTNVEAYKKSLISGNKNPVEYRFIDENLNRCCSVENMKTSKSSEVKRALELNPVLKKLDFHLDIHSTYNPSEAMLITTDNGLLKLPNTFNVDTIYSGIPNIQVGKPFIDITERNGGIGIGLEAGCEKDTTGFKIGVENSVRLLTQLGMLDIENFKSELQANKSNTEINVYDSIVVEGEGFIPSKNFKHKDIIKKGEAIGTYKDKKYVAPKDSYILMPNNSTIGEEFCFLGEV